MHPIIIIGTQRSGSNLLRLMLNEHSQIAAPHPPHILLTFFPLMAKYGDLSVEENFEQLATDVCDFVSCNPVPWDLNIDAQQIMEQCASRTLVSIYARIYEAYARLHDKSHWCCKSMANLYYIPEIEQEIKPFYIHLVRDGRDVAASFKKAIVGEKHSFYLAKQWKEDQDAAELNCRTHASERYIPVMYESLIRDPRNTLKILFHHLGLEFEENALQYYKGKDALQTAEAGKMWDNVKRPVIQENSNKFMAQLTEDDVLLFESIAGETLERHGYTPYFDTGLRKKEFSEAEVAVFKMENDTLKAKAVKDFDLIGIEKRKAQSEVIERIKKR